jgi:hypothetical protein
MTMINPAEAFGDRDFRGVFIVCAAALLVWIAVFALAAAVFSLDRQAEGEISSSDEILNYVTQFKALPRTPEDKRAVAGEPLGVVSGIVDVLKLRERTQRLQSGSSGVTIQMDRLFGGELLDFLVSAENSGLVVRAAEIKAMPVSDLRLLSASLIMEPAK